jgi:hypothetical protein
MLNKIFALLLIPLSIIIALKFFQVYNVPMFYEISYAMLGAIVMIIFEIVALMRYHLQKEDKKLSGIIIPSVLLIPVLLFFGQVFFPISNFIDLVLACVMFTEGLYCLH